MVTAPKYLPREGAVPTTAAFVTFPTEEEAARFVEQVNGCHDLEFGPLPLQVC